MANEVINVTYFVPTELSTTSTECGIWGNVTGDSYTLAGATLQSPNAITGSASAYFRTELHMANDDGHATVMGTLSFLAATSAIANSPEDFTLSSTASALVVADGEGVSLLFTDVGATNTTIAANTCVTLHLLRGEGAGQ